MYKRGTPGMFEFTIGHGGRSCKGTEIHVKVDPVIEDFIKNLGDGSTKTLGGTQLWYGIAPEKPELYMFGNGELPAPSFEGYALNAVGKPLLIESAPQMLPNGMPAPSITPGDIVNLSFLRFKGISGEDGIRFGLKLPYSAGPDGGMMAHIKMRIGRACSQLCRDFIVPVQMRLVIINEE